MLRDNAKRREQAGPQRLDWQGELEAHLADLDGRLRHPRRRATDTDRQPTLPELGQVEITTELLDEIAWRVSEQIRFRPIVAAEADNPFVSEADLAAGAARKDQRTPDETRQPGLRPGKIVMIRFRLPRLPWPFRLLQRRYKRREHPLTTTKVRA
jgi:hypothetical protein